MKATTTFNEVEISFAVTAYAHNVPLVHMDIVSEYAVEGTSNILNCSYVIQAIEDAEDIDDSEKFIFGLCKAALANGAEDIIISFAQPVADNEYIDYFSPLFEVSDGVKQ